ncbi:hypothetical protein Daesc_008971 [Daldinia eschscholtzii]|uniref:Protein kinase domain-containing protein n=1 Tax=Daldinia eschscholtzii TaxID=292717 RepID=A0AAX6M8B8_9PEZI
MALPLRTSGRNAVPATPSSHFISYLAKHPQTSTRELVEPYLKYEARLRELFAGPSPQVHDLANLIPVYNGQEDMFRIRTIDRQIADEHKYIMPLKDDQREEDGSLAITPSLADYRDNFDGFTHDWSNIVVAGSAALLPLLSYRKDVNIEYDLAIENPLETYYQTTAGSSDIDIFIYGLDSEDDAVKRIIEIESVIRKNQRLFYAYENRLFKYRSHNFEVYWDSLDRSRVKKIYVDEEDDPREITGLARLILSEQYLRRYINPYRLKRALKRYDDGGEPLLTAPSGYASHEIPYGERFTAERVRQFVVKHSQEPYMFGTILEVTGQQKRSNKNGMGRLPQNVSFIKDNPGRQMIGSFHPITDGDCSTPLKAGNKNIVKMASDSSRSPDKDFIDDDVDPKSVTEAADILRDYFSYDPDRRFHLEKAIGAGANGIAWRVKFIDLPITKRMILKVDKTGVQEGFWNDATAEETEVDWNGPLQLGSNHLVNEKHALKILRKARHIVNLAEPDNDPLAADIDDLEPHGLTAWLFMEYLENGTLCDFVLKIARRIQHGDMHDQNVMFGDLGNDIEHSLTPVLKVIDFGVAREFKEVPENKFRGEKDNVFQAGTLMVELITLERTDAMDIVSGDGDWTGYYSVHANRPPVLVAPGFLCPGPDTPNYSHIDQDLFRLVMACLAVDPAERPPLAVLEQRASQAVRTRNHQYYQNLQGNWAANESDETMEEIIRDTLFNAPLV